MCAGLDGISFDEVTPNPGFKVTQYLEVEYLKKKTVRFNMGGATDFKLGGTKQDSRAERTKKMYPHFSKCGGTSKHISVGAY